MNTLAALTTTLNGVFAHAVNFAQLCFALAMLFATARLVNGPAAQDRVLALDAANATALAALETLLTNEQQQLTVAKPWQWTACFFAGIYGAGIIAPMRIIEDTCHLYAVKTHPVDPEIVEQRIEASIVAGERFANQ